MKRKAVAVVVGAALAATLYACSAGQEVEVLEPEPKPEPDIRLERSVPSPLVLLHGLGGDRHAWNGLREFLRQSGLRDGGVVRIGPHGEPQLSEGAETPRKADFFALEISDPYQSLQAWTAELERLLEALHRQTGGARLVLVGHSAGGLTGRKYLVENPGDHRLAKLVTVASPHRGSNLALLPLALRKLRDTVSRGDEIGFVSGPMNQVLARLERSAGTPLDSPILEDLKPEDFNPDLAALNRSTHPDNVEYGCLRALGDPAPEHWDNLKEFVTGKIRAREVNWSRVAQDVAEILRGGNSFQGDGAVSVASQDLNGVDFFRRQATPWIQECRGVNVGHSEIKEEYQEILSAITSPVRIVRAHQESDGSLVVDFHDYFAGKAEIEAYHSRTEDLAQVSPPAVFQRRADPKDVFGRVTITPSDTSVDALDIVVRPLDGHRYGQRILLTGEAQHLPPLQPEPIVLKLLRIENIPKGSWLPLRDDDGWRSDLKVLLTVNNQRVLTTDTYPNVGASVDLNREVRIDVDPDEASITLELWDVDFDDPSDLMGKISWLPGMLPQGPVTVRTGEGITVRLEVQLPIRWEEKPLVLHPGTTPG